MFFCMQVMLCLHQFWMPRKPFLHSFSGSCFLDHYQPCVVTVNVHNLAGWVLHLFNMNTIIPKLKSGWQFYSQFEISKAIFPVDKLVMPKLKSVSQHLGTRKFKTFIFRLRSSWHCTFINSKNFLVIWDNTI